MYKTIQGMVGEINFERLRRVYHDKRVHNMLARFQSSGNLLKDSLILCNFCGNIFTRKGPNHSESLVCPVCGSSARDRVAIQCILLEMYHQSGVYSPIFDGYMALKGCSLLECSPKRNEQRRAILEDTLAAYVASDYDFSGFKADIQLDLTQDADIASLKEKFNIVVCAHVLEHIPQYSKALQNLYDILAPGGILVLQVPLLEAKYKPVTWDEFHSDHTRVFHRFGFDLIYKLEEVFDNVKIVVGELDFSITSTEISRDKYAMIDPIRNRCLVLGEYLLKYHGLGMPDLCDAFIARKALR